MVLVLNCLLYYSVFLLFLKLEYILHFYLYHNITLTIQHCFTLIQLSLFQPTWTENKQINLSTNKTNQPNYLPL